MGLQGRWSRNNLVPPNQSGSGLTLKAEFSGINRLIVYLDQFRVCAAKLIAQRDPCEEAIKVVNMFDYDQDGIISVEAIEQLAQEITDERTMPKEEIDNMIDFLDHNGKGGVNLEEFI
ncbi:EF-hand domain pair domain-containing protein [Trichoderma breve]|uniref:EF-hand domain pair domain-containing protein n=1 Tax=Trichoderma breve TaxID=2034170 RepID=A0A9W9EFJ0_9HYPO|nr:EF-hand domain pair domain-containing protein [Trichoderma breve]KAJ4865717.1 EF-hand domain pair domain-containing protein [Trichoderma breve]